MDAITKHLRISGRVQGVGFRYSFCDRAVQLDLTGWVRNTMEGEVEAMVQGPADKVMEIIQWAHKGSMLSRVEKVDVDEGSGNFGEFEIRHSV